MKPVLFETRERIKDQLVIIDLIGEINTLAKEVLTSAYLKAQAKNSEWIALNFSEVTYINSTGIALIVGLLSMARKNSIKLVVFGLSQHYQEIFEITRLSEYMEVFKDEDSVLQIKQATSIGSSI